MGLWINLGKSVLVSVGNVPPLWELTNILECQIALLPLLYLGFLLGASFKTTVVWEPIIKWMECYLAGWKHIYLSKRVRFTLISSILFNLPTYYLSLFPLSAVVASQLERIQMNFLWGFEVGVPKVNLVNWESGCPLSHGGLVIKKLCQFNASLLGKWL